MSPHRRSTRTLHVVPLVALSIAFTFPVLAIGDVAAQRADTATRPAVASAVDTPVDGALAQPDPAPPHPVFLPRIDRHPAPDLALEGQVGGATWAVAAREDVTYVGIGPRIVAWHMSHSVAEGEPVEMARSDVLERTVRDLVLDGDTLYAALGGAGVARFDVADPERIVPQAARDLDGEAGSLTLDGGRLYVALGKAGVAVLDAAQPSLPVLGGWTAPLDGEHPAKVFDIAPHGALAYAAVDTHGLLVLDVADPARMTVVGEDAAHGEARRVTRVAETAWVAADNGEVHVYDLREPRRPRSFAQAYEANGDATEESTAGFAVDGTRIAVSGGSLDVWDVADPLVPKRTAMRSVAAAARHGVGMGEGVAWSGTRILVGGGTDGSVRAVDASGAPTLDIVFQLAGIGAPSWPTLFGAPDGRTLFSRDHRFDVGDASAPRVVGGNPMVEPTAGGNGFHGISQRAVAVDDRSVYGVGGDAWNLLVAFDLTDASRPRERFTLRDPEAGIHYSMDGIDGWATDVVAVAGTRIVMAGHVPPGVGCPVLAVASTNIQQRVLSPGSLFSVRGHPFFGGRHHAAEPAPHANYVAIALSEDGTIAVGVDAGRHCITDSPGQGGIETFDLSDPLQPRFGHRISTPFEHRDVVVHGHHAFVAASTAGLRVYDIADVDAVREVGVWDEGDEPAVAIAMAWPHVLLARSKRLDLVDIRDPGHPTPLAYASVPGVVKALRLYRGRAWVLTEDAGLVGYRFMGIGP